MKPKPLDIPGPVDPYDKWDTIFARARLRPSDGLYNEYYSRRRA